MSTFTLVGILIGISNNCEKFCFHNFMARKRKLEKEKKIKEEGKTNKIGSK